MAGDGRGDGSLGRAFTARATAALTKLQYAHLVSARIARSRIARLNSHTARTTHQANPEQQNGRTVERYRSFYIDNLLLVHRHIEPNVQSGIAVTMVLFWVFFKSRYGQMFGVSPKIYAECVQA